jgi:hypothetical protein
MSVVGLESTTNGLKRVPCIFAQKYTLRGVQKCLRLELNCDLE